MQPFLVFDQERLRKVTSGHPVVPTLSASCNKFCEIARRPGTSKVSKSFTSEISVTGSYVIRSSHSGFHVVTACANGGIMSKKLSDIC